MNTLSHIRRSYPRHEAAECGHGHCAASEPCTGNCKLKAAILNLPVLDTLTDDRFNLHRVDTSQLSRMDGRAVGGCRTDLPVGLIEPIPSVVRQGAAVKTVFIVGIALVFGFIVFSSLP